MVLGARLRTVMSSIIRWRKAETLWAGGMEYAEGVLLLIGSNGNGKSRSKVDRQSFTNGVQRQHATGSSWQPNSRAAG